MTNLKLYNAIFEIGSDSEIFLHNVFFFCRCSSWQLRRRSLWMMSAKHYSVLKASFKLWLIAYSSRFPIARTWWRHQLMRFWSSAKCWTSYQWSKPIAIETTRNWKYTQTVYLLYSSISSRIRFDVVLDTGFYMAADFSAVGFCKLVIITNFVTFYSWMLMLDSWMTSLMWYSACVCVCVLLEWKMIVYECIGLNVA